jgi:NADPH-dependent curcumin reductase CurA
LEDLVLRDPAMDVRTATELQALSDQAALDGGEILNRPTMRELAQALKVALELLLSQAVPLLAHTGWQTHCLSDGKGVHKINPADAPVSTRLGVLGMHGFTA